MGTHNDMKQNRPRWKTYLLELAALGVLFVGRASFADPGRTCWAA
ncbi:hypothetical protein [Archangium violaceum]|nr:hypothetical protein [Archangium violaceum]